MFEKVRIIGWIASALLAAGCAGSPEIASEGPVRSTGVEDSKRLAVAVVEKHGMTGIISGDETSVLLAELASAAVALSRHPSDEIATEALAEMKRGDGARAARPFLPVVPGDSDLAQARASLDARHVGALLYLEDSSAALGAYTIATEHNPGDPVLWFLRARLHMRLDQLQAAARADREMLRRFEASPRTELAGVAAAGRLELGRALRLLGEMDAAEQEFDRYLALEPVRSDARRTGEGFAQRAMIFKDQGRAEEATRDLSQAQRIFEALGDRETAANAASQLGWIHYLRGDLDAAERTLAGALRVGEEIDAPELIAKSLDSLGVVAMNRGELDRALDFHRRSLDYYEAMGDRLGSSAPLSNLGVVYSELGENDQAERYYRRSLVIAQDAGHKVSMAASLGNLGVLYADRGEFDRAIDYHLRSLALDEETGNQRGIEFTCANLAAAYSGFGDPRRAAEYSRRYATLLRESGRIEAFVLELEDVGILERNAGNLDAALGAFREGCELGSTDHCKQGVVTAEMIGSMSVQGEFERAGCELGEAVLCYNHALQLRRDGQDDVASRYERAGCDLGDPHSCNNVGYAAEVAGRLDEAQRQYVFACDSGSGLACFNLGKILWKSHRREARERFREACRQGYEPGCRVP